MPAHEDEAREAEREGVRINWLHTITAFDGPEMTVEVMQLDDQGFPQPTGQLEPLAADTLILAVGQDADTAFLRPVPGVDFKRDGTVMVSATMMTGCPGVFAGGDMVPAERTVTVGWATARRRPSSSTPTCATRRPRIPPKHATADFGLLHPWYFTDTGQRHQPEREPCRCRGLLRGGRRPGARQARVRGEPLPVLWQLLRVRRLFGRLPRGRDGQAGPGVPAIGSTTTCAPAAEPATTSARCTPSR